MTEHHHNLHGGKEDHHQKINTNTIWFDNLDELMDAPIPNINRKKSESYSLKDTHRGFKLGPLKTNAGVAGAVANGWPEGLAWAERLKRRLDVDELANTHDRTLRRRRKRRRGDQGEELDMEKVYAGELDTAWTQMHREHSEQNTNAVALFINVGGLATVDFDDSMWRAAATLKMYELLTNAGRSLKIVVGSLAASVYDGPNVPYYTITASVVKDYGEPLSTERLAAMANIGFHRSFNFRARCCSGHKVTWGMGRTVNDHLALPYNLQRDRDAGVKIVHLGTCLTQHEAYGACLSIKRQLEQGAL